MTGLDATGRLADGRAAVDVIEEYVAACQRLGYQHRDLTSHPAQVREWYDSEDGLDLRALDADCSAFAVAATAAEDAARMHADLAVVLSQAWSGRGAAAAREFVWRSGQAGSTVGSAIRGVADALVVLRDELWRAVDAKVAAVESIEARHQSQRAEWLGAAKTVTTGAGDLASASELIDMHVKPFVNGDIGSDWVAAMRSAITTIGASYDTAIARTSTAPAHFDVPGELGPTAASSESADRQGGQVLAASTAPSTSPAAAQAPMAAGPPSQLTAPSPALLPASAGLESAALSPSVPAQGLPPSGGLGGGPPSLGSGGSSGTGLSGFGQQLADLIGSLTGAGDGGPFEPATPDDATAEIDADEPEDDEPKDDEPKDDQPEDDASDGSPDDDGSPEDDGLDEADEKDDPAVDPEATAVAPGVEPPPPATPVAAPAADPLPPAAPVVDAGSATTGEPTPCEIAADELPQVGE